MKPKKTKAPAPKAAAKRDHVYNVWDSLCDTAGDATKMKLRCWLAMELEQHIKARRWSKATAAKRCGVPLSRFSELHGKFASFTADELAEMLGAAGLELQVRAVKSTFGLTPPD